MENFATVCITLLFGHVTSNAWHFIGVTQHSVERRWVSEKKPPEYEACAEWNGGAEVLWDSCEGDKEFIGLMEGVDEWESKAK